MIEHLNYRISFSQTGATISGDHKLDKGLIVITGPNGAGKSILLEMVGYALWGTKALRGNSEDYKAIQVTMTFTIRNISYRIERSKTAAILKLVSDSSVVAKGAKPVDQAVARLLGYTYGVFGVANWCSQGELEALGRMRPADRKRLVDQTVGLHYIDKLVATCASEAGVGRAQARALGAALVEPIEPVKPDGYRPSADVASDLEAAGTRLRAYQNAVAALARPPFQSMPVAPEDPFPEETLEDIQAAQKSFDSLSMRRAEIAKFVLAAKPPKLTEQQIAEFVDKWKAYALWQERQAMIGHINEPKYTQEQLLEYATQLKAYERWTQRVALQGNVLTCANCGHVNFAPHGWDDVKDAVEVPPPAMLQTDITWHLQTLSAWQTSKVLRDKYAEVTRVSAPTVSQTILNEESAKLALWKQSEAYRIECAEINLKLQNIPDRSADIAEKQHFTLKHAVYESAMVQWDAWLEEKSRLENLVSENNGISGTYKQLQELYLLCQVFEAKQIAYEQSMVTYGSQKKKVEEFHAQADDWDNARTALADLKLKIKGFLIPSLNQVSSYLLGVMTAGKRNRILCDEEFEVLVDNQPLHTLEGSGKAVANLALRIGLGLVLTNKVFSVFMGDELDGSMDALRAGATMNALTQLSQTIGQVMVVTHKGFDGNQIIRVGE